MFWSGLMSKVCSEGYIIKLGFRFDLGLRLRVGVV